MPNLVQEIPDENVQTIYAVDYSRLTTILWGVCKNRIRRIEILEKKHLINQSLFVDQILYKTYH